MRASQSTSLPHRNTLARITCEAARELPRRSPSKQHSLSERSGRGPRSKTKRVASSLPSNSTRRSHHALRLHQAESPRTLTPPSGLATQQHRAPRGAPRRVSRSAWMPDRARPLSSSNPSLTSRPAPPGGVAACSRILRQKSLKTHGGLVDRDRRLHESWQHGVPVPLVQLEPP